MYYTLGQHKGLGVGGVKGNEEGAYFVYKKDVINNILYVAQLTHRELLQSDDCILEGSNLLIDLPSSPLEVGVKFRYRQADQPCYLEKQGDVVRLRYLHPVEAVTPGQAAVIYVGDKMIGR